MNATLPPKRFVGRIAAVVVPLVLLVTIIAVLPGADGSTGIEEIEKMVEAAGPLKGPVTSDIVYRKRRFRNDLLLDIYHPTGSADVIGTGTAEPAFTASAPVVVIVHGGSWFHGDKSMVRIIDRFVNKMRDNGIAVVAINYTSGYLGGFRAPLRNVVVALTWIRDHGMEYGLDPRRLGLYGVSAGAHLSLMATPAVMDEPGIDLRFVLEEYGPTDLVAMAGGDAFQHSRAFRWLPKKTLERYSPVRYVDSHWPPVLIFHGEEDEVVSIRQSELLVSELERNGVSYQYHPIPGGNHGFFNLDQTEWRAMEDASIAFMMPLLER